MQSLPEVENGERDDESWLQAVSNVSPIALLRFIANILQWLKHAQELMSSTASNYDMTKLIAGQALAALTLFFSVAAAGPIIKTSFRTITPFMLIALAYGIMMFASSYVEEEQHFWYWATTAWLVLLWIKKYVLFFLFLAKAYIAPVTDNGEIAIYSLSSLSIS
jgi:ethanolaminephosphotransferase